MIKRIPNVLQLSCMSLSAVLCYLLVLYLRGEGWGLTSERLIKIDSNPVDCTRKLEHDLVITSKYFAGLKLKLNKIKQRL